MSDEIAIFVSVKQQVNNIAAALRSRSQPRQNSEIRSQKIKHLLYGEQEIRLIPIEVNSQRFLKHTRKLQAGIQDRRTEQ